MWVLCFREKKAISKLFIAEKAVLNQTDLTKLTELSLFTLAQALNQFNLSELSPVQFKQSSCMTALLLLTFVAQLLLLVISTMVVGEPL